MEYTGKDKEAPAGYWGRMALRGVITAVIFVGLAIILFQAVPVFRLLLDPVIEGTFSQETWDGIIALLRPLAFLAMIGGIPVILFVVIFGLWTLASKMGRML